MLKSGPTINKRVSVNMKLTDNQKSQLIDLVESHQHLHKRSSAEYHDVIMKDSSWEAIAKTMEIAVGHVKTSWSNLRDQFSKYTRARDAPSGSTLVRNSAFKKFKFADCLMFLKCHIAHRNTQGSIPEDYGYTETPESEFDKNSVVLDEKDVDIALRADRPNLQYKQNVIEFVTIVGTTQFHTNSDENESSNS